jgi:hypothetical protein
MPKNIPWRVLAAGLVVVPVLALPEQPEAQVGQRRDESPILAGELRDGQPWDLAGAVFAPGADLDGVDFSRADLTGAVLREVYLRGACLTGALLQGADFTGARFSEQAATPLGHPEPLPAAVDRPSADAPGEAGDDPPPAPPGPRPESAHAPAPTALTADLSHFFAQGLPLGTIRELALGNADQGHPKDLFPMGSGLAWTTTWCEMLFFASPTGLAVAGGRLDPAYLGWMPEKKTVWLAAEGGRHLYALPARVFTEKGSLVQAYPFGPLVLPPSSAASRPGGMVRSPNGLFHRLSDAGEICRFPTKWLYACGTHAEAEVRRPLPQYRLSRLPLASLVACQDGKVLCLAKDALGYFDSTQPLGGSGLAMVRTQGIKRAVGSADGVWFTSPVQKAICFLPFQGWSPTAEGRQEAKLLVVSLGAIQGQVFDLAMGPDGNVWFTELLSSTIGRLHLKTGAIQRFPLPIPGSRPAYLIDGGDGKLYFTQLGSQRLGSITALEPTLAPARLSPSLEGPSAEAARPASPLAPRPAVAPAQTSEAAPVPAPAPPARPPSALQTLARQCPQGVNWSHIQAEHRYAAPSWKGQFLRSLGERERLAECITRCLTDPLCPLFLTCEGKWMALRAFPEPVGYYLTQGDHWASTHRMVVVLSPDRSYVVTAYPVGPHF